MDKTFFVYIMTNFKNSVFYTGVTNNLARRVQEHKNKLNKKSFTTKYNINKLIYFEVYDNPSDAITREKQIKAGSRQDKLDLINSVNKELKDITDQLEL